MYDTTVVNYVCLFFVSSKKWTTYFFDVQVIAPMHPVWHPGCGASDTSTKLSEDVRCRTPCIRTWFSWFSLNSKRTLLPNPPPCDRFRGFFCFFLPAMQRWIGYQHVMFVCLFVSFVWLNPFVNLFGGGSNVMSLVGPIIKWFPLWKELDYHFLVILELPFNLSPSSSSLLLLLLSRTVSLKAKSVGFISLVWL
jgi:hypothetical protein